MSLYRTWRPKTFADLVGQDAVVRTLTSAIESGKVAHAYLFSGPRGSGKTSAAKIMARCLDCVNGPTAHPDNTCEACAAILAGTALDVLEIDAASNRGIDEIRALREAVKFAPSTMRYKVYIIDEAHMLTKEGANAFLKTLEEPPAHAIFILATTEPERLPVTILSRCQRYAFRRIAIPVMIERMRAIADAEQIAIDDNALAAIAYRADGGLRDALTMLEQAAAFADGTITTQTLDVAFGATGRNYARSLLDAVLARDASGMLRIIEEASDAGTDMQVLMRALIAEFRNLLVARVDPELLARDLAPEDAAAAAKRAPSVSQETIVHALRLLSDSAALARSSGNARLELESALLRFVLSEDNAQAVVQPQSTVPPQPVILSRGAQGAPRVEGRLSERSESKPPPTPAPAKDSGPPTLQKVRAAWTSICAKAEAQSPPLRAPLSRAVVAAVDGNTIQLRIPDSIATQVLRTNAAIVEGAIADVLGIPMKIAANVDAGASREQPSRTRSQPRDQHAGAPAEDDHEDPDALFQYASERIGPPR